MPIDYTYRIQSPHRPGSLARLMGAIGQANGLIGDVSTINIGRDASIREITIECQDDAHADQVADAIGATEGMKVFWYRDRALIRHEGGKLDIKPSVRVEKVQDVRDIYTPGVARACAAIVEDPAQAARLTMIGRSVAICTNGTRVLGLGDIGPVASRPVMEGKAVFYRQFAGISAMPILINAKDVDGFVARSEEHTSELQSRQYLVCRLLLEKKKKTYNTAPTQALLSTLTTARLTSFPISPTKARTSPRPPRHTLRYSTYSSYRSPSLYNITI